MNLPKAHEIGTHSFFNFTFLRECLIESSSTLFHRSDLKIFYLVNL